MKTDDTNASNIMRGDVFLADLDPVVGCETGGTRPVVIIQNDVGNMFSPTIIAAVTSKTKKQDLYVHVGIEENSGGLTEGSTIMLEQIRTIDRSRLIKLLGHLDKSVMRKVDKAVSFSLGLK